MISSVNQYFWVITKPIRRYELILGKLLGIIIIDTVLLVLFGTVLYVCTMLAFHYSDASSEQVLQAKYEFFTSRMGVKPKLDYDGLYEKAQARFVELKENNQLPEGMSATQVLRQLRGQEIMKAKSTVPGEV